MPKPFKIVVLDGSKSNIQSLHDELQRVAIDFQIETIRSEKDLESKLMASDHGMFVFDLTQKTSADAAINEFLDRHKLSLPLVLILNKITEELKKSFQNGISDYLIVTDMYRVVPIVLRLNHHFEIERTFKDKIQHLGEKVFHLEEEGEHRRKVEFERISRDLHDQLGQELMGVKIDIKLLRKSLLDFIPKDKLDKIEREFNSVFDLIDQSAHSIRNVASSLRPDKLEERGLIGSIQWLAEYSESKFGIRCETILPEKISINDDQYSVNLFRIAQETLNNAIKHAQATHIIIRLEADNESINLTISDNGKGIKNEDLDQKVTLGLKGLRERVHLLKGKLEIAGSQNSGTKIFVSIPLDQQLTTNEEV